MKYSLLFIFFLCSFGLTAQKKVIKIDTKETSLENVILLLESDYNYLFSYKEDAIENISVTPPSEEKTIADFLTTILKDSPLQFEIVNNNYIILTEKSASDISTIEKKTKQNLCGKVVDKLTQSPLELANIYLKNSQKGATTNEDGSFQFETLIEQEDSLVISYIGYQEEIFPVDFFANKPCPSIALDYLLMGEDFIVVTDYLTDGISLNNNAAYTELRPQKIGALPGQAEPDVFKTIQFLPGISSADGTSSSINIRGGTSDQNLILWEEIPIYHSAHYFGNISAFNPYIIDKAKVYRGGFEAAYGGRISGVIDLKSGNDFTKKNKFGVGANMVNVFTNGNVSLLNNKANLIFSLRRSYDELGRTPTFEQMVKRVNQGVLLEIPNTGKIPTGIKISNQFNFLDSNIKASYQISNKDNIAVSWFYTDNDFESTINDNNEDNEQRDSLFMESKGVSIVWKHDWGNNFSSKITALNTDYRYDYKYSLRNTERNNSIKSGLKKSSIIEQQIHLVNSYKTNQNHTLKFGYQLVDYDIDFEVKKKTRENNQIDKNQLNNSLVNTAHVAFNSAKDKKMGIDVGLRFSHFQKNNQSYFEPRLRLWYQVTDALNFHINAGQYHQFLSQVIEIEGDESSIETPVWVLAGGDDVPVLNAKQIQVGLVFQKKSWLVDIQAYYKTIDGLTSLSSDFDEDLARGFLLGSASIKGIDVLIKKRWQNYRAWVSYAFNQNTHEFPDFFDDTFSAPNERPHALHFVNQYTLKNWQFSLGWKIVSGTPYADRRNFEIKQSPPTNGMMDSEPQQTIRPTVLVFNDQRLPFLHHLDCSVNYTLVPKNNKWKGVFGLSIFNMYDKNNTYYRGLSIDEKSNQPNEIAYSSKKDLKFTPNLVIRFEW